MNLLLLLISFAAAITDKARAEGFYIDPQSVEGMGFAQAGIAVGYSDGSSAFHNPAALVTHDRMQLSMHSHVFLQDFRFKNQGSTVGNELNIGTDDTNGGHDVILPAIYYVAPLTDQLVGSLYVNSPFGLGTEYARDWVGRYQAVESSLTEINLGSAVGYNLGSGFSIGGGMSVIHAEATLSSAVDFGTIGTAVLGPDQAAQMGLKPQRNDGFVEIEGKDWSWGANLGGLYRYGTSERNRIGVAYRAKSILNIHGGDADYTVPSEALVLTENGQFTDTGARAQVTLPEAVMLGSKSYLSDEVFVYQQSTWTRWSHIRDLVVNFDNPNQAPSERPQDWKNTWFHSAGLGYTPKENLELRIGVGFDNGVIPNARRRYPTIATSDSIWASIGAGIVLPEYSSRVDIAFTRLQQRGGFADTTGPTGDRLHGDWSLATNAISSAVTMYW